MSAQLQHDASLWVCDWIAFRHRRRLWSNRSRRNACACEDENLLDEVQGLEWLGAVRVEAAGKRKFSVLLSVERCQGDGCHARASAVGLPDVRRAHAAESSDTLPLFLASMDSDDRKLYDNARQGPAFAVSLDKARAELAKTPAEEQRTACKSMHDGLKKP